MRRLCLISAAMLLLPLAGCLTKKAATPPPATPTESHIRIEPSRRGHSGFEGIELRSNVPEGEIGLVFYPGATILSSMITRRGTRFLAAATLTSRDSYAGIVSFYRTRYAKAGPKVLVQELKHGQQTLLNWQQPSGNLTVCLRQDRLNRQTVITLTRTGQDAPPQRVSP